jgi:uncharacterized membrane protein YcaP (DUF421 family)
MDLVLRAVALYLILMILLRLSGRRAMSELTGFDLILLLIVAEVTDNALLGHFSFTQAMLIIVTLFTVDILLSFWKQRSPIVAKLVEGTPVIVVDRGKWLGPPMKRLRVSEDEVLQAARASHGLQRIAQVRYAIVESSGKISIIPEDQG